METLTEGKPQGEKFISTTVHGVDIHLPIGDLVDPEKECQRLAKEEEKIASDLTKLEQRLGNPDFIERAKPEIIERDRALVDELKAKLEKVAERKGLFGCS